MRRIILSDDALEEIEQLQIKRTQLPANPVKPFDGRYYLWLNYALLRPFYDIVLRQVCTRGAPQWKTARDGREFVRLEEDEAARFDEAWQDMPRVVAIQDNTRLCVAMDLNFQGPGLPRTEVGELVYQAKYQKSEAAMKRLCELAAQTAVQIGVFDGVRYVCPIPPSKVNDGNDLPERIARSIADALSASYRQLVRTVRNRTSLKSLSVEKKARSLQGTLDAEVLEPSDSVLLVDDHYQSGKMMNYVARGLLGDDPFSTVRIYGFACDKTLSNRDNTAR